jgi:hypothetical protein
VSQLSTAPREGADDLLHKRQAQARANHADSLELAALSQTTCCCGPSVSHVSAGQRAAGPKPSADRIDALSCTETVSNWRAIADRDALLY